MRSFYLTLIAALACAPASAQAPDRRVRVEISHPAAGLPGVRAAAELVWRDRSTGAEIGRTPAGVWECGMKPRMDADGRRSGEGYVPAAATPEAAPRAL